MLAEVLTLSPWQSQRARGTTANNTSTRGLLLAHIWGKTTPNTVKTFTLHTKDIQAVRQNLLVAKCTQVLATQLPKAFMGTKNKNKLQY